MSKPEIKVNLKKTHYTAGGPIATGIFMAVAQLKSSAETISSISLTDTEIEAGSGLRFEIAIQIPNLIPDGIVVTEAYFGPQTDHLIATFIVDRWKNALYSERARIRYIADELDKITYLGLITR